MQSFLNISLLAITLFAILPALSFADTSKHANEDSLKASAKASLAWLELVDKNKYAESWEQASALLKLTIQKDDWGHLLTQMRKPLGSVTMREVLDQRTAKNPHGLPHGDYMVMFYKTNFAHKNGAFELVTLFLEDGEWRTVTYQVN